jgi:hypothetical protein
VDTVSRGLSERPEVADLSDEQLLERVAQARQLLREARERHDMMIADAMIRGINQSLIAKTAGLTRRAIFYVADREWKRRHAGETKPQIG